MEIEHQEQEREITGEQITLAQPNVIEYSQAEWVFQFDDNEPVVFAWSNEEGDPGEVNIKLKPNSASNLIFTDRDGTRTFKMFARPISEPTLKMIEQNGEIEVEVEDNQNN